MSIYARYLLPRFVHLACSAESVMDQRAKVIPRAEGSVLEIGVGSGLNLPYYDGARVTRVVGVDPSPEMRAMAERVARDLPIDIELVGLPDGQVPLDANSVDTVVITYTLCTIPDVVDALAQMRRVLKPGGRLLFCEHGAAPEVSVRRWQNLADPLWHRFGGGCHLNRDIPTLIREGGFRIGTMETGYIRGWRPVSFNYWGDAVAG